MKLSVVTCAYNPDPAYLRRMADSLHAQTLPADQWEYVVVDNRSRKPILPDDVRSAHPRLRIVVEEEQGLTPARLRGVRETSAPYIVFVDDDMVLDAAYLERALQILAQHDFIGALGGAGRAEYAIPLAPWMEEFRFMWLDHTASPERLVPLQYAYTPQPGPWVPLGAGMIVRRDVATHYARALENDSFRRSLDRTGGSLCGSGDADLAYSAIDLGYACASSAQLSFLHLIPARRLDPAYLEKLLYLSNYFTARLLVHRGWKPKLPIVARSLRQRISDAVRGLKRESAAARCWKAFGDGYRDGRMGVPPRNFDAR